MALGRRKQEQQEAWVVTTDVPRGPGHVFYGELNALFAECIVPANVSGGMSQCS